MLELRCCPFCGSEGKEVDLKKPGELCKGVVCSDAVTPCPCSIIIFEVEVWNKRHEDRTYYKTLVSKLKGGKPDKVVIDTRVLKFFNSNE